MAVRRILLPLIGLALLAAGCGEKIESNRRAERPGGEPEIPRPVVERDLKEITRSGHLRMITYYNSRNYFIHRGGQAGFDYELLDRFARTRNLTIDVVIAQPGDDLVSMLNSGRGDVVCVGHTPSEDIETWVNLTRPVNFAQKVVVLNADDPRPDTLAGLAGLSVTVPLGCPTLPTLLDLREETQIPFFIDQGLPSMEIEELLAKVSRWELDAVVVNDTAARSLMTWLPNLRLGPTIGTREPAVWLVRDNTPELQAALDKYLEASVRLAPNGRIRRNQTYGIIHDRYFSNPKTIKGFLNAAHRPDKSGRISRYDEEIRRQSEKAGFDWRLIAALIYQESRFNPHARSKADARGLMQLLPNFAGAQADSLYYPEANLRAGLRLMTNIHRGYAYLDSLDRWRFSLAEYHAGHGHVSDARRMLMDGGSDPNKWDGGLAKALPKLMEQRYYSRTRHGYYGGAKTVLYVKEILNRYRMYRRLVPLDPAAVADSLAFELPGGVEEDLSALPDLIQAPPPPE